MNHLLFYSKKLEIFKPVNIKLLKNLSDCEINIGEIVQLCATPANVHLGRFSINGSGKCFFIVNKKGTNLIEGKDFLFI